MDEPPFLIAASLPVLPKELRERRRVWRAAVHRGTREAMPGIRHCRPYRRCKNRNFTHREIRTDRIANLISKVVSRRSLALNLRTGQSGTFCGGIARPVILSRKAARLTRSAPLRARAWRYTRQEQFVAVPFLRRGVAVLRPANDLGSLSPFGYAEHLPVDACDCVCGQSLRCHSGRSSAMPLPNRLFSVDCSPFVPHPARHFMAMIGGYWGR
jgi:hypothetical protein